MPFRIIRKVLRANIDRKKQRALKNHEFTLFCNNCVGGMIYTTLGERFDTPTINCFFPNLDDYIEFLKDLDYYLTCGFIEKESEFYPIGLLDGKIEIHFVHYDSFETAIHKWRERCGRVHWDNIYAILVQRDGCTEQNIVDFLELPIDHKVVLAADEHAGDERIVCIPGAKSGPQEVRNLCAYKTKFSAKRYIDDFDYISWLNE